MPMLSGTVAPGRRAQSSRARPWGMLGLPVVTMLGDAFAGRVAASLLKAIGLPELVTHSLSDYEALASRLAANPILLESYRNRLNANRSTYPLFDTGR